MLACLLSIAQQQFPYTVVIDTVVGDCFNNCQAVVTLRDAQGHLIPMDDSLHHPVDSVAYPISGVQYHYKNQLYNSVFYSDSHILTMDVGTYDIGVSGYVTTPTGPVLVDTTFYGIALTSTYNPFSASVLANIAEDDYIYWGERHERCGNRHALPCGNRGRVQMKLTSGNFPYTVIFTNAQQDTIRYVVFNQPQHNGTDSTYADYRYYYTFDSLPAGTYRIEAYDACSYTLVFSHTVELNDVRVNSLQFKRNPNNYADSNTVRFRAYFYCPRGVYNYDYDFFETLFEYRFIHTNGAGQPDTSSWRPIDGASVANAGAGIYCDTLKFAGRYCDLYGHTVRFEVRDSCRQETASVTMTLTPPDTTCYVTEMRSAALCFGQVVPDTCHATCDSAVDFTEWYRIWYNCGHYNGYTNYTGSNLFYYTYPLQWVYTDSATGQVIKTDPVNEITVQSYLTNTDVESVYGTYSYLPLPVVRSLVDAHGCVIMSRFDTLLFVRDTTPAIEFYPWKINSNFNRNNYSSCFNWNRTISVYEEGSPFPLFRDSTVVRLVKSPLYNLYNFTATYANGGWTIVKDDTIHNDASVEATGMNVSISENHLSGGLYIFVCETPCGVDTLRIDIDGIYYNDWEWIEEPAYETWQECNDLLVKPVAGKYRCYTYHIDSQVSNDEPIASYNDYYPSIALLSGEVGGYSATSTSMNVPFRFTIPGEYVIRMSFSGCYETYSRIDTIHFVRVRVDFDKAYAVVCDSSANTGTAIARAFNGSRPYTYRLYSQPDMHGSLLGTNQSGLFYSIPMSLGQELSIQVIDSCESSYYINIAAMSIEQSQLLWFEGGTPDPGACVGDTLTLEAFPMNSFITYSWQGPMNFTATGEQINYYVADTLSKGWIVVELLNTGCQTTVKDSLFLNVFSTPQVFISAVNTVCAGDTVEVQLTARGSGTVNFNMGHLFDGAQSFQSLSVLDQDTLSLLFPIESDNLFWVTQVADQYCPGNQQTDTVQVSLYPITSSADSTHISGDDLLVCYGSDAMLFVTSDLNSSCILSWYDNDLQSVVMQQDTLCSAGDTSTYTIPQLVADTTLYVAAWYQDNCPAHIGRADLWMNMQDGTTSILPGQGVRLYDSGGGGSPYANNEAFTHTFQSPNNSLFLVRFNSFGVAAGDTLFVYSNGTIVGAYTGTTLPDDLTLPTSSLTFRFVSDHFVTALGWSIDILTPAAMTEVSASVVHFFDTLTTTVCQTDDPFSYSAFPQIDISDTGIFQLDTTLFSVMGCDSNITLKVEVLPVKSSSLDTVICEGREIVLGDYHYAADGVYQCNFTADNGCDSVVTVLLDVIESTTQIISSEEDFCEQVFTILSLPDVWEDYRWSTGATTPMLEVVVPGTYSVTTHRQGCEVTASCTIPLCEWELYLPNAITAGNSDGLNDYFCLLDVQKRWIVDFEIFVYDRWGEVVYSSRDKNFRWDGSVNGRFYPNVVYNYIIRLKDIYGERHLRKGMIVVLG